MFEEEDKFYLQPLPPTRYKLTDWKTAKVQLNYHIQAERMYNFIPYDNIREHVDIPLTTNLIEVYFKEARNPSHKQLKGEIDTLFLQAIFEYWQSILNTFEIKPIH